MFTPYVFVSVQHDTCPVCRMSLSGEDSSQPQSESPSLPTDPRTQERWSFWDPRPPKCFSLPFVHLSQSFQSDFFVLFLFYFNALLSHVLYRCLNNALQFVEAVSLLTNQLRNDAHFTRFLYFHHWIKPHLCLNIQHNTSPWFEVKQHALFHQLKPAAEPP